MMDCRRILENEFHEKYLLQRLSATQKETYEAHLRTCSSCRKELENERLLISGIRGAAHNELRQEIKNQIEGRKESKSVKNWTYVMKVAAVILFVIISPAVIYFSGIEVPLLKTPSRQSMAPAQTDSTMKDASDRDINSENPETTPSMQPENSEKVPVMAEEEIPPQDLPLRTGQEVTGKVQTEEMGILKAEDDREIVDEISERKGEFATDVHVDSGRLRIEPDQTIKFSLPSSLSAVRTDMAEDRSALAPVRTQGGKQFMMRQSIPHGNKLQPPREKLSNAQVDQPEGSTPSMRFISDNRTVMVHFISPAANNVMGEIPGSFEVDIIDRSAVQWEMNWHAGKADFGEDIVEAWLEIIDEQTAHFHLSERIYYLIEIGDGPTRAYLIEQNDPQ